MAGRPWTVHFPVFVHLRGVTFRLSSVSDAGRLGYLWNGANALVAPWWIAHA